MKIKIRPHDATSMPEEDDWLPTDDWLAALRDDGRAEPAMAAPSRRAAAIPGQKPPPRPLPLPRPLPAPRPLPLLRPVPGPR